MVLNTINIIIRFRCDILINSVIGPFSYKVSRSNAKLLLQQLIQGMSGVAWHALTLRILGCGRSKHIDVAFVCSCDANF